MTYVFDLTPFVVGGVALAAVLILIAVLEVMRVFRKFRQRVRSLIRWPF